MIVLKINYKRVLASVLILALISCSNPWDDREDNGDVNLSINLTEAITNRAETSKFAKLLVETGYDKILAASKTFTVFVPTDAAMAQVGNEVLNNPEALKLFIGNHIALTAYSSERNDDETQVKMYSNKYLTFKGATLIDDASIITANLYASNGVFHIIDKPLTPKLNIWEYIKSQAGILATSDYLLSLKEFNIYQSDSLGKAQSQTIGPGFLADSLTNSYLKNVYNLNNEENSYTFFLMENDGYTAEVNKMKPYLIKTTNDPAKDSTAIYAKYFTLRDMAFHKKYELNQLPATLVSRFGVEVPVDKTQIVRQIHLSNGIVYIMKKVDVPLSKRLVTTKIEGEKNIGFFNGNRSAIFYRERKDPISGLIYNDVIVQDPRVAQFMLDYSAKDLYSTKYKVVWRAINNQTNVFSQGIRFAVKFKITGDKREVLDSDIIGTVPYTPVQIGIYQEVEVGEITLAVARNIDLISLIAANTTTNGNNSLTLDYLKLVPVLK